jgi:phage terminase large subunit-like protein
MEGVNTAPTYRGFLAFARALGVELPAFQREIARAHFAEVREVVACLPKGNGKTQLASLIALHHLVSVASASVSLGSASRQLAEVPFTYMRRFAEHPALVGEVTVRHMALRTETGGLLRVVSGQREGGSHAQTDSLMLCDELWCHADGRMLEGFEAGLVKRADARLLVISTAPATLDSPMGRLRRRAMAGEVTRQAARIDACTRSLRWLEWSLPNGADADDLDAVAAANPAPWVTRALLSEQHERCPLVTWRQFHANVSGAGAAAWLPPGTWSGCQADYKVIGGERVVVGVDIGGSRAASAVVAVTDDLRVASVWTAIGNDSVLDATEEVRRLAACFSVREVAFDPWRFKSEALRLEAEGIGPMVEFPQSYARMVPASERLHAAIVEGRLRHPGDPDLDAHVAAAIARPTGRGWRLDKSDPAQQIDAAVALAMCVERAQAPRPEPVRVLGWV